MLRKLRYLFLVLLGILLLIVALANRDPVVLRLLPEGTGDFLGIGWAMELPLFIVIFAGIVAGLLIGFVWEWFREAKHRSEANRKGREVEKLEREVSRLRDEKAEPKDEVLALLEKPAAGR
ncbi:LapA family protein [Ostreiculturibacter nitratireducens]|uniref:LapA family protein n=1 Tax=Ostreiculturibacter nitratireducens TaxID=3075226 RepID=UPI0031B646AC